MITAFIGHLDMSISDGLKSKLTSAVIDCINNGADTFYCGGYGAFDSACAYFIKDLKGQYPNIRSFLVTPYMNSIVQKKLQ